MNLNCWALVCITTKEIVYYCNNIIHFAVNNFNEQSKRLNYAVYSIWKLLFLLLQLLHVLPNHFLTTLTTIPLPRTLLVLEMIPHVLNK